MHVRPGHGEPRHSESGQNQLLSSEGVHDGADDSADSMQRRASHELIGPHLTALAYWHLLLAKELDGAAHRGRLLPSGPDLVMFHES